MKRFAHNPYKKIIEILDKCENKIFGMPSCWNCGKTGTYQSGMTPYGTVATWCSRKCEESFLYYKKKRKSRKS